MDWTDLQENWVPLSDPDKFRKYAKENSVRQNMAGGQESYFEADKGTFYSEITEFDFTNIPNIEKEIMRITELSGLKNNELLSRIIAVTMMKMRPKEVTARERFAKEEKNFAAEPKRDVKMPVAGQAAVQANDANKTDNAPPDFWYPM
jgi:hypothetical protein